MGILNKISSSQTFKIFSLNSISVFFKIGIGLLTSKLIAVFIGPSGMALVGNLRNFMTALEAIATLGFQNGIVKYTAESQKNKEDHYRLVYTVFITLLCVCLGLSALLFLSSNYLTIKLFGNNYNYSVVFKALALALPLFSFSVFMLAVLNGLGQFKKVIWISVIGNAVGFLISLAMILKFKTVGALLSLVISPALLFVVVFYNMNKEINFLQTLKGSSFDFTIIQKLSSFSLMAVVSSVVGPLIFLAIRQNVIAVAGIEQAGFWETVTRISTYYMLFATTILSVYFLPKLATAKDNRETKIVFWSYYKSILPLFIVGLVVLYLLRFYIVNLLFTAAFLPVTKLFFWQFVADGLKVAYLILGYQFFAKKLTVPFIIAELFSLAVLYFSSIYFVQQYGVEGVVMAQAFDNFLYLGVVVIYFRRSLW